MNLFPITAKLTPRAQNWFYLASTAALTRLATGFVRVNENRPSKLEHDGLNENEKRLAFIERFFVEIIGTIGNVFTLHLGQDLYNNLLEKKLVIPQLGKNAAGLTDAQLESANRAIREVWGLAPEGDLSSKGVISRVLYGKEIPQAAGKSEIKEASLKTLREKLLPFGEDVFNKVRPHLEEFVSHANRRASLSIVTGVILSAAFGGFGIQWMNDRIVSPIATRILKKIYGDQPSTGNFEHPVVSMKGNNDGQFGQQPAPAVISPPVSSGATLINPHQQTGQAIPSAAPTPQVWQSHAPTLPVWQPPAASAPPVQEAGYPAMPTQPFSHAAPPNPGAAFNPYQAYGNPAFPNAGGTGL